MKGNVAFIHLQAGSFTRVRFRCRGLKTGHL
jgi:hypothetical protein